MHVYIPKPLVIAAAALGGALALFVLREEIPPLYRYLVKFEAM